MREICTSGSTRGEEVAPLRRPLSYSTGSEADDGSSGERFSSGDSPGRERVVAVSVCEAGRRLPAPEAIQPVPAGVAARASYERPGTWVTL